MQLRLTRKIFTEESTIGELQINGTFECFTLEDVVRNGPKVPGKTAIPVGAYTVVISFSQRFGRPMPELLSVPNFAGIRIHAGNKAVDTEGCILVGRGRSTNAIDNSRVAYDILFAKLSAAAQREKIFIEIVHDPIPIPVATPLSAGG